MLQEVFIAGWWPRLRGETVSSVEARAQGPTTELLGWSSEAIEVKSQHRADHIKMFSRRK